MQRMWNNQSSFKKKNKIGLLKLSDLRVTIKS